MGRKSWAHWISGSCPSDLKKSDFNELIQVIIELILHYVYVVLWNSALIFFSFQGEPGLPGLRGPEGAPGVGIQGEKVRMSY